MDIITELNGDDEDNPEVVAQTVDCLSCEVRFSVILADDYLHEDVHYCPFCGEYIVGDE